MSPPTIGPSSTPATEVTSLESTSALQFPEIPRVFDIPSSTDDVIDTPFLDAWTEHLRAQRSDDDVTRVRICASSVQDAAHGLWLGIMALTNGWDLPALEAGQHIDDFTIEAIMNGSPRVQVYEALSLLHLPYLLISYSRGDSIGDGVLRAVWSTMWNNIISPGHGKSFWTPTTEPTFMTLSLRTQVLASIITEEDARYLRGCGFAIRISIIWGLVPGPLSPSFILYLISGSLDKATSQDFLRAVQPAVESRLETWPPPKITREGSTVFDLDVRSDPWTLIASCTSFDGTQVCSHSLPTYSGR